MFKVQSVLCEWLIWDQHIQAQLKTRHHLRHTRKSGVFADSDPATVQRTQNITSWIGTIEYHLSVAGVFSAWTAFVCDTTGRTWM